MVSLIKNTRRPDITFFRDGRILITARIARLLNLATGDVINIAIHDNEYLLFAKHNVIGRHEAQCYPTKRGSHNFCANSIRLSRALLDACNIPDQKASFMMGEPATIDNQYCIPIITGRLL